MPRLLDVEEADSSKVEELELDDSEHEVVYSAVLDVLEQEQLALQEQLDVLLEEQL